MKTTHNLIQLTFVTILFALIMSACTTGITPNENTALANPASVYCEEQKGVLDLRSDPDGNQYGVCIFEDGSECEEWAYFREECSQGEKTVSWEVAVDLIHAGKVETVFQLHNLSVTLALKDNRSLETIEPRIDAVFDVVEDCGDPCSDMMLATE
jgi:putative hemolysin